MARIPKPQTISPGQLIVIVQPVMYGRGLQLFFLMGQVPSARANPRATAPDICCISIKNFRGGAAFDKIHWGRSYSDTLFNKGDWMVLRSVWKHEGDGELRNPLHRRCEEWTGERPRATLMEVDAARGLGLFSPPPPSSASITHHCTWRSAGQCPCSSGNQPPRWARADWWGGCRGLAQGRGKPITIATWNRQPGRPPLTWTWGIFPIRHLEGQPCQFTFRA